MEDVEEAKEAEEVDDADSTVESRLARKVASFGMVLRGYYTPERIESEEYLNQTLISALNRFQFTLLSSRCHTTFTFVA
jgi:hypothetical protein